MYVFAPGASSSAARPEHAHSPLRFRCGRSRIRGSTLADLCLCQADQFNLKLMARSVRLRATFWVRAPPPLESRASGALPYFASAARSAATSPLRMLVWIQLCGEGAILQGPQMTAKMLSEYSGLRRRRKETRPSNVIARPRQQQPRSIDQI